MGLGTLWWVNHLLVRHLAFASSIVGRQWFVLKMKLWNKLLLLGRLVAIAQAIQCWTLFLFLLLSCYKQLSKREPLYTSARKSLYDSLYIGKLLAFRLCPRSTACCSDVIAVRLESSILLVRLRAGLAHREPQGRKLLREGSLSIWCDSSVVWICMPCGSYLFWGIVVIFVSYCVELVWVLHFLKWRI